MCILRVVARRGTTVSVAKLLPAAWQAYRRNWQAYYSARQAAQLGVASSVLVYANEVRLADPKMRASRSTYVAVMGSGTFLLTYVLPLSGLLTAIAGITTMNVVEYAQKKMKKPERANEDTV